MGVIGWSADPGLCHMDLNDCQPGQRVALVVLFTEADPTCRRSYREQLSSGTASARTT